HGLLADRAAAEPDRLAVADQPNRIELTGEPARRLSFRELDEASDTLAAALLSRGIGSGSIVMAQLPNIAELVICYYALSKLGAIISPVPVQYGSHELSSLAAALEPDALISIAQFRDQALAEQAAQTLGDIPVLAFGRELSLEASTVDAGARAQLTRLRRDLADDANRIITICWTSGTTGTPKGVPRSHNMWMATARTSANAGDYRAGEILLNPFPLVNMAAVGGFLYAAAMLGCALVLHHPLDPTLFLRQMQEEQINFTIAPPALLNQLAKNPELWHQFDFSALRAVGSGSAPLSPEMIATVEGVYGKPVINYYGSNEGISLFSTPDTAAEPEVRASMFPRFGVAGMPFDDITQDTVRSKVIDADSGEDITTPGIPGELCFAGATVFDGYLGDVGAEVFTADGFFRTGDLVEICGEPPNYYRIVGRCKDIINRGGMKISPSEIDTLLEGFDGLAEAAVCAYPDDKLGEKICACVVPQPGREAPTLQALCDYLLDRGIAKFKLPERIEIMAALPRNPMNKVMRQALQDAVA
ncbi:MAG: acyl--CoA ligase, partial [Gammaproteobacteria bacterium]|nr:acyl--CoA ligase [Gammaproteobacteria bacterium]